ncbi:MAG: hypothetical protein IJ757_08425 [Clostridiales bacterium]|nr:hypothetical protein [Clostridiales bacterium]
MNKKLMSIVLAACVAVSIAACSGEEEDTSPVVLSGGQAAEATVAEGDADAAPSDAENAAFSDGYVFTYNGTVITMNAPADDIIAALGDGYSYFEAPSCAYEGMDKVYTYNSIVVRSYTRDGVDYIAAVELKDDTVATAEGIRIGSTEEDVLAAYGEDGEEGTSGIEYTKGDSFISLIFESGRVVAITYTAIVG